MYITPTTKRKHCVLFAYENCAGLMLRIQRPKTAAVRATNVFARERYVSLRDATVAAVIIFTTELIY